MTNLCGWVLLVSAGTVQEPQASADWPQFMRTPEHTGDAPAETLSLPLGLVAQIKADDAILASPAVVGDAAYAVDQMGAACAFEWRTEKLLWKSAPDGEAAMGSNTSSPCVAGGRVYFGTTAGTFHVLDAATGRVVRTLRLGWPVTGSPTHANDSIYFQTLGAQIHCIDRDGNERWKWDHYRQYVEPRPERFKGYHPGGYAGPHFGGGEVAVSGKRVVTSFGWDHVCVEDAGTEARLVWCNRAALGKDDGIPMQSSIDGGFVYTGWPGVDGAGTLLRVSLADGSFDPKKDQLARDKWAVFGTPAARGGRVYFGRHDRGLMAHDFASGPLWSAFHWSRPQGYAPVLGSPALTKEHVVYGTAGGELVVVSQDSKGQGLDQFKPAPFRFQTSSGKPIGSSPAVSRGHVFFGSDDGFLYVLGPGGRRTPREDAPAVHPRRSRTTPAGARSYAWPSPYGSPTNANFVDDAGLKPPLRLRWAARSLGAFVAPLSATEEDLIGATLEGAVICLEQQTGRLRWRRRITPAEPHGTGGALCLDGRIYVVRQAGKGRGLLHCLDGETGATVWTAPVGATQWYARNAPVAAEGRIAFGHLKGEPPVSVVEAWDARTGAPAWEVRLENAKWEGHGCAVEGVFLFSGGARTDAEGETVAIEAKTGKVLWRTRDAHCGYRGTPSVREGRAYLSGWGLPVTCVSAADGSVVWRTEQKVHWGHVAALGPDYFTGRGYSGHAEALRIEDGKAKRPEGKSILLGGPDHACGPVLLTSGGFSFATTVSGLYVRDASNGKILWSSPGFAPRSCSSPIAANGRLFYNPQVNGMLYCFEPEK